MAAISPMGTMEAMISQLLHCSATALTAFWLLPLDAAAQQPPGQIPNVVLIVSDDQRPDTIAALGNPIIQTPHLDTLVRSGITMTRAICANPICTPSRAEILSGSSGLRTGIIDFGGRLPQQLVLWPEQMRKHGYRTWYVGKWHNAGTPQEHGYEETKGLFASGGAKWIVEQQDWKGRPVTGYRGWVLKTDEGTPLPQLGVGLTPDISATFADAAIEFIRRDSSEPFFLHINFTAPHDPLLMPPGYADRYDPQQIPLPENFLPKHPFDHGNFDGRDERLWQWPRTPTDVREELQCYYAVISHMDQQIGRVLDQLKETGEWSNTIVIFTSDHGLAIGSHGLRGKQNMYEHTIGVPLILCGPEIPAGQRRDAQVYLRDLYPTVCDLAGLPIPEQIDGRSFAPVLFDKEQEGHRQVFGYFRDAQRMIRTNRYKLIHYPQLDRYQLFDLHRDPHETEDLAHDPGHQQVLRRLRSDLENWQQAMNDPARDL